MKLLVGLVLFLLPFVLTSFGTMSLYHFSGTTFLNLRKLSNPASLDYEYRTFSSKDTEIPKEILKKIEQFLNPKGITTTYEAFTFEGTIFGDVVLSPGHLHIPKLKTPNGEAKYQGWIEKEEDYYTKEQEQGDIPVLKELIKIFENYPTKNTAIRVSVEVTPSATLLRDLMVNFYRKENREHMANEVGVIIQPSYSTGFIKRITEQQNGMLTYDPTMERLYDDYIIRQLSEYLNITSQYTSWVENINILRAQLLERNIENITLHGLEILPVLLASRPDDEITKKLSEFITPSNTVQFREFVGDIEVSIKRAVGFVKVTELYGPIVADSAASQVSFTETTLIQQIRKKLIRKLPIVVKYMVLDPEKCPDIYKETRDDEREFYEKENVLWGNIPTNIYGTSPIIIPDDSSVIWHQRTEHRFNLIGKYNPSLINFNLAHFLENKYFEFLFFEEYCPNFLPKTRFLYNILPKEVDPFDVPPEIFVQLANKHFPDGWIIKGVWDYNGILHVTTFKDLFVKLIRDYRNSTFDKIVETTKSKLPGCEPIEALNVALKNYPHFKGWKNNQYLKDSSNCIIQSFQKSHREYRIECFGGDCPKSSMTDDHRTELYDSKKKDNELRNNLLKFYNNCIEKFPDYIRALPFTSDIAILPKNKGVIVYETNPGGNSWLIHHTNTIASVHHKYMKKFPKKIAKEEADHPGLLGLSEEKQMIYLKQLLNNWGLELSKVSRRFEMLRDRLTDHEHIKIKEIIPSRMNYTGPLIRPPKVLDATQIKFALSRFPHYYQKLKKTILDTESDDYLEALRLFATMKHSFSHEDFIGIQKLIQSLRLKALLEDELNEMEKFNKFITPLTKNNVFIIDEKSQKKLFNMYFGSMKDYLELRFLNVEHYKFEQLIQQFDQFFLKQNVQNFNTKFFDGFDLIGTKTFDISPFMEKKQNLIQYRRFFIKFNSVVETLYAMERTGLSIPGFSFKNFLEIWLPKLRSFYSSYDKLDGNILTLLLNTVSTIIDTLSDYSLFKLNKNFYQPEIDLFMDSFQKVIDYETAGNIGISLHIIKYFGLEKELKVSNLIPEAEFYITFKQGNMGAWKDFKTKTPSMEDTKNAMYGLLNHENIPQSQTSFLELVDYERYLKTVQNLGFLKYKNKFPKRDAKDLKKLEDSITNVLKINKLIFE